jgi:RimJ/RimL family protein N-acetyltransferase
LFGQHRRRCRRYGLHIVRTNRLWVVSARHSDFARYVELASEPRAQHWLGWPQEDLRFGDPMARAEPFSDYNSRTDMMWPGRPELFFAAIERRSRRVVAGIGIIQVPRPALRSFEIGGAVHADFRGRDYGTEAMSAVLRLAHRHFGLSRLLAGCERDNHASARWLAKSGFVRAGGSATHVLPNGREIEALRWVRQFPPAEVRCPWLSWSVPAPLPGVGHGVGDDVRDVLVDKGVGDLASAPLRAHDGGPA